MWTPTWSLTPPPVHTRPPELDPPPPPCGRHKWPLKLIVNCRHHNIDHPKHSTVRKNFYFPRFLVKCCSKEILCTHRLLKIRGTIAHEHYILINSFFDFMPCLFPYPKSLKLRVNVEIRRAKSYTWKKDIMITSNGMIIMLQVLIMLECQGTNMRNY